MVKRGEIPCGFGYDESNNGRYPSIHVLTHSIIPEDFHLAPDSRPLNKQRDHSRVNTRLKSPRRNYSFLLFTESDLERLEEKYKVLGVILGSLLFKEQVSSPVEIYIDGARYEREIDFAYKCVRAVTGLNRRKVDIIFSPKMDIKCPIVNLADEIANWLLRKRTPFEKLRDTPHRKPVLRIEELV
jgi:hypothetical protein